MRTSVEEHIRTVEVAVQENLLADLAAHPLATSGCLLLTDILALAIARWTGYTIWLHINPQVSQENHFQFLPSLLLYLVVYAFQGIVLGSRLEPGRRSFLAAPSRVRLS